MADDAVFDAIKTFLSTAGNISSLADPDTGVVPPIRFENEAFETPNPPSAWIAMALTGVIYGQESMGAARQADNRWDETGHLWLPVLVASGTGASRGRWTAKRLANLFRGLTLLGGSLEFMDAFIGEGAPSQENGNWFELPVAIEWRRVEA